MPGLFAELKRRNVFKVGAAYASLAWLLAQGVDVFLKSFDTPDWAIKTILFVLLMGFPLALFFAWAFELTPDGIRRSGNIDQPRSGSRWTGRALNFTIAGILTLTLGIFLYDRFILASRYRTPSPELGVTNPQAAAEPQSVSGKEVTAAAPPKSIAVLPFVNMSEDPGNEYFSDGMSEEILNALAQVKGLRVVGRTSSFAFKGKNLDLRQIAAALGVAHVLEGSVRKAGTKVRITAQLIQASDGFHLWSETYDRELDDVFAIQDEIAMAILAQLRAQLLDDSGVEARAVRANAEAYNLYLLAKQQLYQHTMTSTGAAANLLDKALAIDPEFAPALANRGIATLQLSEDRLGTIPVAQSLMQSRLYLDKSLEIDPDLAEGWAGMGLYYIARPASIPLAIQTLEHALAINPSMIDARNWLHGALVAAGRLREAQRVLEEMIDIDPLYLPGILNAIHTWNEFGQQEEALAHLERIQPFISDKIMMQAGLASTYLSLGRVAESLDIAASETMFPAPNFTIRRARSLGLMFSHQYERAIVEAEEWVQAYALAFLGRTEEASALAFDLADREADATTLFSVLNILGRSHELTAYLETHWPDLAALQEAFPPGAFGYTLMVDVALAYARGKNEDRFQDAMQRVRAAHDELETEGVDNFNFFIAAAAQHALSGDVQRSLGYLDRAIAGGLISSVPITLEWPALEVLKGNPRFEAIQQEMTDHLNRERAQLGLDPVQP